jgi:hypothetical protein
MIQNALIVVGPGGVGKGPLGDLFRDSVVALDPYRLRLKGPRRDSDDPFYAHPKLRNELTSVLSSLGDRLQDIPCAEEKIEWFPKSKVLMFTVRREWQCLILHDVDGEIAKAELYAPVLPAILAIPEIHDVIGSARILILNPTRTALAAMANWTELESATRDNCVRRGDKLVSVEKRVASIVEEAPWWRTIAESEGGRELAEWPFAEYRFKNEDKSELLRKARRFILDRHPDLGIFFKSEGDL